MMSKWIVFTVFTCLVEAGIVRAGESLEKWAPRIERAEFPIPYRLDEPGKYCNRIAEREIKNYPALKRVYWTNDYALANAADGTCTVYYFDRAALSNTGLGLVYDTFRSAVTFSTVGAGAEKWTFGINPATKKPFAEVPYTRVATPPYLQFSSDSRQNLTFRTHQKHLFFKLTREDREEYGVLLPNLGDPELLLAEDAVTIEGIRFRGDYYDYADLPNGDWPTWNGENDYGKDYTGNYVETGSFELRVYVRPTKLEDSPESSVMWFKRQRRLVNQTYDRFHKAPPKGSGDYYDNAYRENLRKSTFQAAADDDAATRWRRVLTDPPSK